MKTRRRQRSWRREPPLRILRHLIEYSLVRLIVAALARAPVAVGESFGAALGRHAYRLRWRRAVVEAQLARAFPEQGEAWVRDVAESSYMHIGREIVAMAALPSDGLEGVRRCLVSIEGREALAEAYAEGQGIVMVAGHFGNWEVAGSGIASLGYPVDAVMQSLHNSRLSRLLEKKRNRLGMELIDRGAAWQKLQASLAAGRVVAFAADQDARGAGVFVPFFGRLASTHRAPALLAIRSGAPFFVGGATRVGPREYRGWAVRLDPMESGGVKDKVLDLTWRWTRELERRVRLSPEQYFWHHRRWKTRPAGTVSAEAGIGTSNRSVTAPSLRAVERLEYGRIEEKL